MPKYVNMHLHFLHTQNTIMLIFLVNIIDS